MNICKRSSHDVATLHNKTENRTLNNKTSKDMATTYIYKGQEISHTRFITLCRMAGVNGGHKKPYYQILAEMSERGETKASELMKDLDVIDK